MIGILEKVGKGSFFLDGFTEVAGAYSLRKLTAASHFGIKVRRISDHALTDVVLPKYGSINLDSEVSAGGTLGEWVGGGTAHVHTWYDQSPVGNHAINETAINSTQPKIILNGVLIEKKGRTTLDFSLGNMLTAAPNPSLDSGNHFSAYAVASPRDLTSKNRTILCTGNNANGSRFQMTINPAGNLAAVVDNGPTEFYGSRSKIYNTIDPTLTAVFMDGSNRAFSVFDNGAIGEQGQAFTGDYINGSLLIGFWSNPAFYMDGHIQEIITFASEKSAERSEIETGIMDYYQITP